MKKGFIHTFGYFVVNLLILSVIGGAFVSKSSSKVRSGVDARIDGVYTHAAMNNGTITLAGSDDLQMVDERAVRHYSDMYGVDYRLILAMIKQESMFNEEAVSERGAQGLMQIMPVTNSEIMEELDVQDAYVPGANLQAGTYYFSKLLSLFKEGSTEDRLSLALAAYNAGPSRVYDAQKLAAYLGENPRAWSSIATVLPLLSKRYYSLHHFVWEKGKPSSGYFGSAKQTVGYVASVMKSYHEYVAQ